MRLEEKGRETVGRLPPSRGESTVKKSGTSSSSRMSTRAVRCPGRCGRGQSRDPSGSPISGPRRILRGEVTGDGSGDGYAYRTRVADLGSHVHGRIGGVRLLPEPPVFRR